MSHGGKRKDPPPLTPTTSDDGSEEDDERRLDWRKPREESHSDWTIEVYVEGDGGDHNKTQPHATYHVHKNVLSLRSEYFERLFVRTETAEHRDRTSRIPMQAAAAEAFPVLLDHVYRLDDGGGTLMTAITHENCTALHSLGRYLEIRSLRKEARRFRNEQMRIEHAGLYLRASKTFLDDSTRQAVVKVFCEDINFEDNSGLVEASYLQFWLDALNANGGKRNPFLSAWIADYCNNHLDDLTLDIFQKLTNQAALPALSLPAALILLRAEARVLRASRALDSSTNEEKDELTEFQRHAIDQIVSSWDCTMSDHMEELKELSPFVLSQLWISTMRKKVEAEKQTLPHKVFVNGAMYRSINGTYDLAEDLHNGAPLYVKAGESSGTPVQFEIGLFPVSDDDGDGESESWFLSMIREGDTDVDHYSTAAAASVADKKPGSRLPPEKGWFDELLQEKDPSFSLSYSKV